MKYKLTKTGKMYIVSICQSNEVSYTKTKRSDNKGYWNNKCRRNR
ncbi:MAG: hypothetical protein V8R01_01500 [Bacilli bacterium]